MLNGFSQVKPEAVLVDSKIKDTIVYKKKYGLRVGVDVSKFIIGARDENFKGLEFVGDYRLKKDLYLAGEFGFIDKNSEEDTYKFNTKGTFVTLGININAFKNWLEMDNEIYYGFRYGFSTFSQTLNEYTVYQKGTDIAGVSDVYFEPATIAEGQKFNNLTGHWVALTAGFKVETFKNLYLGASIFVNKMITSTEPDNFKNLYIPGFNKVYVNQSGVSFNYTISYRIPLYKK